MLNASGKSFVFQLYIQMSGPYADIFVWNVIIRRDAGQNPDKV